MTTIHTADGATVDLADLRAKAEAATPGQWHAPGMGEIHMASCDSIAQICFHNEFADEDEKFGTEADAQYIAAACPPVVLALVARAAIQPAGDAVACKLGGGCICLTEEAGISEGCKYYTALPAAAPMPAAPTHPDDCDLDDEEREFVAQSMKRIAASQGDTLDWAVGRWNAEVAARPLANVHRRALDDTWRQVIRHAGGDPATLIGKNHDELIVIDAAMKAGK